MAMRPADLTAALPIGKRIEIRAITTSATLTKPKAPKPKRVAKERTKESARLGSEDPNMAASPTMTRASAVVMKIQTKMILRKVLPQPCKGGMKYKKIATGKSRSMKGIIM